MATVKPILDTRYQLKDKTYPVIIRVRDGKQVRDLRTGWKIEEKYWKGAAVGKHPDAVIINSRIDELVNQAKQYIYECQHSGGPVKLDLIGKERSSYSWNEWKRRWISYMGNENQYIKVY